MLEATKLPFVKQNIINNHRFQ